MSMYTYTCSMHLLDGVSRKWNEAKQKLWEIKAEDMSCTLIVYMCRSWKEL